MRLAIAPILETSPVRPSFLAHIALEIMLDSLLITDELVDPTTFYTHLKLSDRISVTNFLQLNPAIDTPVFFKFFDHFIEENYLHRYRESQDIMYSLNRICMRIWDDPLNELQKLQITSVLIDYQKYLKTGFMSIFEDIDNHLLGTQRKVQFSI